MIVQSSFVWYLQIFSNNSMMVRIYVEWWKYNPKMTTAMMLNPTMWDWWNTLTLSESREAKRWAELYNLFKLAEIICNQYLQRRTKTWFQVKSFTLWTCNASNTKFVSVIILKNDFRKESKKSHQPHIVKIDALYIYYYQTFPALGLNMG